MPVYACIYLHKHACIHAHTHTHTHIHTYTHTHTHIHTHIQILQIYAYRYIHTYMHTYSACTCTCMFAVMIYCIRSLQLTCVVSTNLNLWTGAAGINVQATMLPLAPQVCLCYMRKLKPASLCILRDNRSSRSHKQLPHPAGGGLRGRRAWRIWWHRL